MSATYHLPQRHLNLLANSPSPTSQFSVRPQPVADRFSQILDAIEEFLLTCTYAEMSNFWNAIANLRQSVQKYTEQSQVPHFLTNRRKQRDFCRILEVLADLPYPKLHLSHHPARKSGVRANLPPNRTRRNAFANPHLSSQK